MPQTRSVQSLHCFGEFAGCCVPISRHSNTMVTARDFTKEAGTRNSVLRYWRCGRLTVLLAVVLTAIPSGRTNAQTGNATARRHTSNSFRMLTDSSFDEFRDSKPRVVHHLFALPTDVTGLYVRLNRKQCDSFHPGRDSVDGRSFMVMLDFGKPLLTADMKESATAGSFLTNIDYVRGPTTNRTRGLFLNTLRSTVFRSHAGETRATTAEDQEAEYIKSILLDSTAKFRIFNVLSFSLPRATRTAIAAFLDSTAVLEAKKCN